MKLRGLYHRLERAWVNRGLRRQIDRVESSLQSRPEPGDEAPVIFFNASTRIHMLSLNGAFSLLASWALRATSTPVLYAVCHEGMQQCVLGTQRDDYEAPPPCEPCIAFSDMLFPAARTLPLPLDRLNAEAVGPELEGRSMDALAEWEHKGYPLGRLCLPGLRWALRRHHLPDDPATRALFRRYLRSAASLVGRFEELYRRTAPRAVVVFNGVMYPEAVARAVAERRGVRTVTHEVGLRPRSAFFSHSEATFREVPLPDDFRLSEKQEAQLDRYLEQRRQGRFTMAGIRFWPQVEALSEDLQSRLAAFERSVAVFTNVIFDTSQVHANVVFDDMFDWLDALEDVILNHPETLFVIRAHPDEHRPGKRAAESVSHWYRSSRLAGAGNVEFFAPEDRISSYQLIEVVDLVLTYNSSIGLEASIMGAPVLSAGRARFTAAQTVYLPDDRAAYLRRLEGMLAGDEVRAPAEHVRDGRRFLYRELYHASLDFSDYLEPYPSLPGMVRLTDFDPARLISAAEFEVIRQGILEGRPFEYSDGKVRAGL